jgi:putative ATP-dependent endonuclease of the OLD family
MEGMLKITNYKCFGEDAHGFEQLRLFNVIVGRNNIGKSTIIELVQLACELNKGEVQQSLKGSRIEIHYSAVLGEKQLITVFPAPHQGNPIPDVNWSFGKHRG